MSITTVKVKKSKSDKKPTEFTFDFGENLADAQKKFDGESNLAEDQVVFGCYLANAKQQLIEFIKRQMAKVDEKGRKTLTNEQIQTELANWHPGPARRGKGKVNKALKAVEGLSEQELEVMLARLKAKSAESLRGDAVPVETHTGGVVEGQTQAGPVAEVVTNRRHNKAAETV